MQFKKAVLGLVAAAILIPGPTLLLAQGQYQNNWGYHDDGHYSERWESSQQQYREISRRAYQDGMEGAWRDYQNRRRPDVRNRDEFRKPRVPDYLKREYREAFNRGYQVGVQRIYSDQRGYDWRR